MQQLLASGAISKLPEEVQWNVRVLLPRAQDTAASGQGQAASGNLGSVQNLSAGMLASLPLAAAAPPSQTPPVVRSPCPAAFFWRLTSELADEQYSFPLHLLQCTVCPVVMSSHGSYPRVCLRHCNWLQLQSVSQQHVLARL